MKHFKITAMAHRPLVNGDLLLMLLLLAGLFGGVGGFPHPKTTPSPGTGHSNSAPDWVEPFLWVVVALGAAGMIGLVGWALGGCCSKGSGQKAGEQAKLLNDE